MARRDFFVGDPVPWFDCPSSNNPFFHFETIAGRFVVLSFIESTTVPSSKALIDEVTGPLRHYMDDFKACFFSVSIDSEDESRGRLENMTPGIRHFWDFDRRVSHMFGALGDSDAPDDQGYRHFTLVLDPFSRVIANYRHQEDGSHITSLARLITKLPSLDRHAGVPLNAPVMILPRVFEPSFCKELIAHYEAQGGRESGFMREKDGQTVAMLDNGFKRRKDFVFDMEPEFEPLRSQIRARLKRRLIPEIKKAFQFDVTRIERYIVACYEGEQLGFFRAHRDNTTKATAHRRFACTINLNADEYEGGDLRFPEFGTHTYRAPTGGAVVFSCSLLHEATPVTSGKRYAFLPFFYDTAADMVRKENRQFLSDEVINLNVPRG